MTIDDLAISPLFDASRIPALLIDSNNNIRAVNRAFKSVSERGINGRVHDWVGLSTTKLDENDARWGAGDDVVSAWKWQFEDATNHLIHMEVSAESLIGCDERVRFVQLRDQTELMRSRLSNEVASDLTRSIRAMERADDLDIVISSLKEGIRRVGIPFNEAVLLLIDPHTEQVSVRGHTMSPAGWAWDGSFLSGPDAEFFIRVWRSGEPLYRPRFESGDERRSTVDVPFSHGVLSLNRVISDGFTGQDIVHLQTLTGALSAGFVRREDMTLLQEQNDALGREQRLWRIAMDSVPYRVTVKDHELRLLRANAAALNALGIASIDEVQGQVVFDWNETEFGDQWRQTGQSVVESGEAVSGEGFLPEEGGKGRWWEYIRSPVIEEDGNVVGVVSVSRDVTERKRLERDVHQGKQIWEYAFDSVSLHIAVKDREGRFLRMNRQLRHMLRIERESDVIGTTDADWWNGEEVEEWQERDRRIYETGEPYLEVIRSGRETWRVQRITPLRDESGKIIGTVHVAQDITPLKRAEEALSREQRLWQLTFDSLPYAVSIKDTDLRFIRLNRRAIPLFDGATMEDVIGTTDLDWFDERAVDWQARDRRVIESGEPHFGVGHNPSSDTWWTETALPVSDEAGNVVGIAHISEDITPLKRAEHALIRERRLWQVVIDSLPHNVVVKDRDSRILRANRNVLESLGIESLEGIIGTTDYDWQQTQDADKWTEQDRRVIETGEPFAVEFQDDDRWMAIMKSPLVDDEGNVTGVIVIGEDITNRRRAEDGARQANAQLRRYTEELRRSNIELQQFAYIASHDLQEPLRKLRSFADLLRTDYGDSLDETGADYLDRMTNAAERMANLIADLLQLSRAGTSATPFQSVDLDEVARQVVVDLETRLQETQGTIELGVLGKIEADATQMRQLFQNLIGNALKFHRRGVAPKVVVTGEVRQEGSPPSQVVEIVVEDNGVGFSADHAERIFHPFERLHGKMDYEGTGMGLAICRRLVQRHHGRIVADGVEGQGARFIVTLPITQPDAPDDDE
ncbi:MAG: PAS domain-containing protein [Candidatus Poribacteria bacterium]|nr:PAS domain-containing protein [Candidatus Poribacteria bacterium]